MLEMHLQQLYCMLEMDQSGVLVFQVFNIRILPIFDPLLYITLKVCISFILYSFSKPFLFVPLKSSLQSFVIPKKK